MLVSIIIRTLNEASHLDELLTMIARQDATDLSCEVVIVDSGSTDDTVKIAERRGCRITRIAKQDFSFGRSLNQGCDFSKGDVLVFISGHCVPVGHDWLQKLCQPILDGAVSYNYGRQMGGADSNYSELRIFAKYFPKISQVPQTGFFCNNANSALARTVWDTYRFDEDLTGLEDMELAKRIVQNGHRIGYVAEAPVYHFHDEPWPVVRRRFEREAIALQKIMPEIQLSRLDMLRYIISSVWIDWLSAARQGRLVRDAKRIALYRYNQYLGSYRGNHEHRKLSRERKEQFFYPAVEERTRHDTDRPHRRTVADEGRKHAGSGQEFQDVQRQAAVPLDPRHAAVSG